jgi:hypothetical protein
MPTKRAPGELARARLDIPIPNAHRRLRSSEVRALEASVRVDEGGALVVTVRSEPPRERYTLPALACLQFAGRLEDALAEALTKQAAAD